MKLINNAVTNTNIIQVINFVFHESPILFVICWFHDVDIMPLGPFKMISISWTVKVKHETFEFAFSLLQFFSPHFVWLLCYADAVTTNSYIKHHYHYSWKSQLWRSQQICQISKILNFHPIDKKFEQDLYIMSLNSTTNYFWGQYRPKGQYRPNFWNCQFSSDWREIWREVAYLVIEVNRPIIFEVNRPKGQYRPKVNNFGGISKILNFHPNDLKFKEDLHIRSLNSTTNYIWGPPTWAGFLKLSIFIRFTWNLKRSCIFGHWIEPPIILRSNLFYGFCKFCALHDVFLFVCLFVYPQRALVFFFFSATADRI